MPHSRPAGGVVRADRRAPAASRDARDAYRQRALRGGLGEAARRRAGRRAPRGAVLARRRRALRGAAGCRGTSAAVCAE